jgi:hypothetical protein
MTVSPRARMRIHQVLVAVWGVLTLGTTVAAYLFPGHPAVMAWLIFISCYAIVSTHWAAYEGAAPSAKEGT